MDVTEGGLSTKHLFLLTLATGIEALTEVDLMEVDPLGLLADDLADPSES